MTGIETVLANRQPWHIEPGDVMAGLRALPANSVNCVCTSPPYFGLRSYGTSPQVWGGDADCPHEWGAAGLRRRDYQHINLRSDGGGDKVSGANQTLALGAFCALCNAWRGEYGSEPTPALFVEHTVAIFREVRRVLHPTGVLWLNMGDSYSGAGYSRQDNTGGAKREQGGKQKHTSVDNLPAKNLLMMPARVAIALQDDGWILRSDIIWHKSNPMPESVQDRPTKAHEYIFLFSKQERYFYDADAVREPHLAISLERAKHAYPAMNKGLGRGADRDDGGTIMANGFTDYHLNPAGRNLRSVWTIPSQGFAEAHFATFPTEIPRRCILAGCPEGGLVLDPFAGSGTTLMVALRLGRRALGLELNESYVQLARRRIEGDAPLFNSSAWRAEQEATA